jgi:hypothetical protein
MLASGSFTRRSAGAPAQIIPLQSQQHARTRGGFVRVIRDFLHRFVLASAIGFASAKGSVVGGREARIFFKYAFLIGPRLPLKNRPKSFVDTLDVGRVHAYLGFVTHTYTYISTQNMQMPCRSHRWQECFVQDAVSTRSIEVQQGGSARNVITR